MLQNQCQMQYRVQTVLDSKHFVKKWEHSSNDGQHLRFHCRVVWPSFYCSYARLIPDEWFMVPLHSIYWQVKKAAVLALENN